MDPGWLTDKELAAWVRLIATMELLPSVLDSNLRRDAELTHFEYGCLAMLSEAPHLTLRMSSLAQGTSATLPRLSHVVRKLEERDLVERATCPSDARAVNVRLTKQGLERLVQAAPGHVRMVRRNVLDALDPEQIRQLTEITDAILRRLDPEGAMTENYTRYDPPTDCPG